MQLPIKLYIESERSMNLSLQESSSFRIRTSNGLTTPQGRSSSNVETLRNSRSSIDEPDFCFDSKCFVHPSQLVLHGSRPCCMVCFRKFGTFRRPHSCHMCGEVVCSKCSMHKKVHVHVGEGNVRICSCCYTSYRNGQLSLMGTDASLAAITEGDSDRTSDSYQRTIEDVFSDATYFDENQLNRSGAKAQLRAVMAQTEIEDTAEQSRRASNIYTSLEDLPPRSTFCIAEEVQRGTERIDAISHWMEMINSENENNKESEPLSKEAAEELEDAREMIVKLQQKVQEQAALLEESTIRNAQENNFEGSSAALRAALAATETARREETNRSEMIQEKDDADRKTAALEKEVLVSSERVRQLEKLVHVIKMQQNTKLLTTAEESDVCRANILIEDLQLKVRQQETQLQLKEGDERVSCGVSAALRAAMAATETARREEEARKAAILEKEDVTRRAELLEEEVKTSQVRVLELEAVVSDFNRNHAGEHLSAEQDQELHMAKNMIAVLQGKLKEKEAKKKLSEDHEDDHALEEAVMLRKRLQKMERQLLQAGLNVVEDIPYEEAKSKVVAISRRMHEIGSSEVVHKDKVQQGALRKEYFTLEQEMEKYNAAMMMSDEYLEEQRRVSEKWDLENKNENAAALCTLRRAIPVQVAQLSEAQLTLMSTPSGLVLVRALARKLKRTNVLELVRCNPSTIQRMHPSVIENYRSSGLTLVEQRALHAALHSSYLFWKSRAVDEFSGRKLAWFTKLQLKLKAEVAEYTQHVLQCGGSAATHSCSLLGNQCPLAALTKAELMYPNLGFPENDKYLETEVLKSEPEGAGEKALAEAKSHARAMIENQRLGQLKNHYGMKMREISQASKFMEELEFLRIKMEKGEKRWANACKNNRETAEITAYADMVSEIKNAAMKIGQRSGIQMAGKRDTTTDVTDSRACVEIAVSQNTLGYASELLTDMKLRLTSYDCARAYSSLLQSIDSLTELLQEVQKRNVISYSKANIDNQVTIVGYKRTPWTTLLCDASILSEENNTKTKTIDRSSCVPLDIANSLKAPRKNPMLAALQGKPNLDGTKAPVDMLASIRARKLKQGSCPNLKEKNRGPKQNMLMEAITNRSRKQKNATNTA